VLPYGVVCVILCLAISVEHLLVTDKQTNTTMAYTVLARCHTVTKWSEVISQTIFSLSPLSWITVQGHSQPHRLLIHKPAVITRKWYRAETYLQRNKVILVGRCVNGTWQSTESAVSISVITADAVWRNTVMFPTIIIKRLINCVFSIFFCLNATQINHKSTLILQNTQNFYSMKPVNMIKILDIKADTKTAHRRENKIN